MSRKSVIVKGCVFCGSYGMYNKAQVGNRTHLALQPPWHIFPIRRIKNWKNYDNHIHHRRAPCFRCLPLLHGFLTKKNLPKNNVAWMGLKWGSWYDLRLMYLRSLCDKSGVMANSNAVNFCPAIIVKHFLLNQPILIGTHEMTIL